MRRSSDWRKKLNVYLRAIQRQPHEYGRLDCALFVAGAVEAMTGQDPAADVRGAYSDRDSADDVLAEIFGGTLEAAACQRFGEPVGPLTARTGDVVLGPWGDDGGDCLGIVLGARVATVGEHGQTRQRLDEARLSWRIG